MVFTNCMFKYAFLFKIPEVLSKAYFENIHQIENLYPHFRSKILFLSPTTWKIRWKSVKSRWNFLGSSLNILKIFVLVTPQGELSLNCLSSFKSQQHVIKVQQIQFKLYSIWPHFGFTFDSYYLQCCLQKLHKQINNLSWKPSD